MSGCWRVWSWRGLLFEQGGEGGAEGGFEVGGDVEEFFEVKIIADEMGLGGVRGFDGADHQIAAGVFGGDEFEDIGFVAEDAEDEGAEGVGGEVGEALVQDAVTVKRGEGVGVEGFVEIFVATGDGHEQAGVAADGLDDGVIGGGVAGVEGEDDVGLGILE